MHFFKYNLKQGFSLIELLVVVAIMGILVTVGFVGYTAYIDTVKDEVGISNAVQVNKILNTDHVAITSGMSARSTLATSLTDSTMCRNQVDKVVHSLNTLQSKTNSYNAACPYAFNGNRAWSATNHLDSVNNVDYFNSCAVAVTANTIKVPRGRLMVACVNNTAAISSADYKLYTCFCSGEAECETTNVGDDCVAPSWLGYGSEALCRTNWMQHSNNVGKCASPGSFN